MCPKPVLDRDKNDTTKSDAAAFTAELAAYYRDTRYFHWLLTASHGAEGDAGRAYSAAWPRVTIVKRGESVTYRHDDWGDNLMIPSARILGQASAAYLWTGDPTAGRVAAEYARGLSATMLGMQWDATDDLRSLMARAVIPKSHAIVRDGRTIWVDYEKLRHFRDDWNTETVHVPANPYWPDEWVQTIRSKDDLPHIYLAAAALPHVRSFAPDADARDAAGEAYDLLRSFGRDVVEHGYWMRSRKQDGSIYYPGLYPSDDRVSDLANFTMFRVYPKGECDARFSTALVAYEDPNGERCGDGLVRTVDLVAAESNFYNYLILSTFHLSATTLAVEQGRDAAYEELITGVASRVDFDLNLRPDEIPDGNVDRWRDDLATYIVYAAAAGMSTPPRAARFVQDRFRAAITELRAFPAYDLNVLGDGEYPLFPKKADEIGAFFWYCWSPYRGGGDPIVDCEALKSAL